MPATISPRRYARPPRSYRVSILMSCCLALLGLVALAGCGGGGGSTPVVNPNGTSILNGTVTDENSAPIVGATLKFGSLTTTSTQNGLYRFSNVVVPTGQTSQVGNVTATATVKGIAYSGQNQATVLVSDALTNNVQIVMSPTSTQGSIIGVVKDSNGNPVAGARVFANVGPFSQPSTPTQFFFGNLGAFSTTTRSDGSYTLAALPPDGPPNNPYTVTASLTSKINQTVNGIAVLANSSTTVPLVLSSVSANALQAPTNLAAQSLTVPAVPTRAAGTGGSDTGFLNAIRQIILQKRGLLAHRAASTQNITLRRSFTRDAPSGSLIETDMFWDYPLVNNQPVNDLYGYDIVRSPLDAGHFSSIAIVLDPLADRYGDSDPVLTPDTLYFYSVAEVDTINHSDGAPATPVAVEPLNALSLVSPASGSVVSSSTPTFTWNAVNRAVAYLVLVYDQFPTLQSDTDPNGVIPIMSANFSGTSGAYSGPALVSGHTYYWTVLGQDNVSTPTAFTVSPLQTFKAP